ncbi:unnamed protein product [Urochloa humidicola]
MARHTVLPWSLGLPPEIAAEVLRRLPSHADRVRFGALCRPWRAVLARHPVPRASPAVARAPGRHPVQLPGLRRAPLPRRRGLPGLLRRLAPIQPRRRRVPAAEPVLGRHHAAPEPVPRPPRRRRRERRDDAGGSVDGRHGSSTRESRRRCARWSRARARSCSAHDRWRRYEDLALCGGRLYALTSGEDLVAFDVAVDASSGGEAAISRVEMAILGGYATQHYGRDVRTARYLVTSRAGALLIVRRAFPPDQEAASAPGTPPPPPGKKRVAVFRADLAASRC